jgi:hypothetical protein
MLLTQRATGDAIPTRIRDNCQVAISFATRTLDGAVAALGEEIRQHPEASPVLLNDPVYVGVAVTSLPGRPGFHRVRTPQVDHHQVAAIIRVTAGLRADPAALLAETAPGLRVALGCRRRRRSHDLCRLAVGPGPPNQRRRLPIRSAVVGGCFRRSVWSRRLARSRAGGAGPAGARPRGAACLFPG